MGHRDRPVPEDPHLQQRTPPYSREAEQSVLGGLLLDNSAFDRIAGILLPEHFFQPDHRRIYATMCVMFATGKPVDVITVFEGGGHDLAYLNALAQSVPSAANCRRYAEIVLARWRARQVIAIADELAQTAFQAGEDTLPQAIDQSVVQLLKVAEGGVAKEAVQLEAAAMEWLDWLQEAADGKDQAISTGIGRLDRQLAGGLREGELIVIGARPSMGKTAMMLNLAKHVSKSVPVMLFQQEDSIRAMVSRLAANVGRVNLANLRHPRADDSQMWRGVTDAIEEMRSMRLFIDDQAALTLTDVRRKLQAAKRKHGVGLAIIDYLQLMTGDADTRNRELGDIANGLKSLAKQLGMPIVLLSQLSRKADDRPGVPQMSDLRDSGDIEGAADIVLLLYREFVRTKRADQKNWAQVHVAKQKNGPIDILDLYFDGSHQQWSDWDSAQPVPRATGRGRRDDVQQHGME